MTRMPEDGNMMLTDADQGSGMPNKFWQGFVLRPTLLFSLLHVSVSSVSLIQPRLKMACIQNLLWFVCNKHQATIGAAGISDASPLPSLIPKDELVNKTLSVNGSSAFGNILIERRYNTPRVFWISHVSYSPKHLFESYAQVHLTSRVVTLKSNSAKATNSKRLPFFLVTNFQRLQ